MRTIEDIILEKNYSDLSVEELNIVSELADNEDEFNQMKQLFENMTLEFNSPEMFAPSSETKASLDQIFSAKHPVIANEWKKEEATVEDDVKVVAFYNLNWVRVAAIFLLFIGISVLFIENSDEISGKNTIQQAGNKGPETRTKSTLEATSKNTEAATVLYPETKEQTNNIPELAFAEAPPVNTEMNDKTTAAPDKALVLNRAANGGTPAYTFSTSGESTNFGLSATSPQPMTFTNSGFTTTVYEKDKKSNWGRLADLDPELNMSKPTTASGGYDSSVSKEGLAAEMLDWIQAAY